MTIFNFKDFQPETQSMFSLKDEEIKSRFVFRGLDRIMKKINDWIQEEQVEVVNFETLYFECDVQNYDKSTSQVIRVWYKKDEKYVKEGVLLEF